MFGLMAENWSFFWVLHRNSHWVIFTVIPGILALKVKTSCNFWFIRRGSLFNTDTYADKMDCMGVLLVLVFCWYFLKVQIETMIWWDKILMYNKIGQDINLSFSGKFYWFNTNRKNCLNLIHGIRSLIIVGKVLTQVWIPNFSNF